MNKREADKTLELPEPTPIIVDCLSTQQKPNFSCLYRQEKERADREKKRADLEMELANREKQLHREQRELGNKEKARAKKELQRADNEIKRAENQIKRAHHEKRRYSNKNPNCSKMIRTSLKACMNDLNSFFETLPVLNCKMIFKALEERKYIAAAWVNEEKVYRALELRRAYCDIEYEHQKKNLIDRYNECSDVEKDLYYLEKERAKRERERAGREKERADREKKFKDYEIKRTRREKEIADCAKEIADRVKERANQEKKQADQEKSRAERFEKLLAHKSATFVKTCRHFLDKLFNFL